MGEGDAATRPGRLRRPLRVLRRGPHPVACLIGDATDVFCPDRDGAARAHLFETAHFYVMPDAFPITPGHILVIPKQHAPCFAALPARWESEYRWILTRVRRFLRETMGCEALVWENGVARQSVHHAHLHIIPMPATVRGLPPPEEAVRIPDLAAVRRWYLRRGPYHYVEFRGDRRILPPDSPDWYTMDRFKARVLGVRRAADGRNWIRTDHLASVAPLIASWRAWEKGHAVRCHPQSLAV